MLIKKFKLGLFQKVVIAIVLGGLLKQIPNDSNILTLSTYVH